MEDLGSVNFEDLKWVDASHILMNSYIDEMKGAIFRGDKSCYKDFLEKYTQAKDFCKMLGSNGNSFDIYDRKISELNKEFFIN